MAGQHVRIFLTEFALASRSVVGQETRWSLRWVRSSISVGKPTQSQFSAKSALVHCVVPTAQGKVDR